MDNQLFGIHEQALNIRALRNQVLASNIANADTPNYKARDIEFSSVLDKAQDGQMSMTKTSSLHQAPMRSNRLGADVQYRIPTQPTLDGNTVETDVEQGLLAQNAVEYRASLTFLDGQVRTLRYALRGGE